MSKYNSIETKDKEQGLFVTGIESRVDGGRLSCDIEQTINGESIGVVSLSKAEMLMVFEHLRKVLCGEHNEVDN